uniref:Uncharacterized protein n=1 Tax=Oryza meridionalis TaxID=40149 RepID=A0A0E0D4G5_9ORYZ
MATQGNESAATTTTTHMVCHQAYPSYNMSAKMPSVPQWLMINDDRATMMTLATGRADCMSRTIFVASMDGHYLSLGCEENASPSLTGEIVGKKIARAKKQKNPRGEGERDSGIQDAALLPPGGRRRRLRLSRCSALIGVISGNVIFGPPLQKYWAEKQQQQQGGTKEEQTGTT